MARSDSELRDAEADITRSKVGRLLEEDDLTGVGEELENRWTGKNHESQSLRDLADWFNQRLLRARMEAAGMNPVSGESENLYRLLTSDDVSSGERIEAERTLEQAGVDTSQVKADFVSYGAIYTYLTKYRGVDKGSSDTQDPVASGYERIQRLRERANAVTNSIVESLRDADHLAIGEFDVQVNIQITCKECRNYYRIAELVEKGGCDCN